MKTKNINIKKTALKINELALKNANLMIDKSLNSADTAHNFVASKVDAATKFSAKAQENMLDNLEKGKQIIWTKVNKSLDFFSKN